MRIPGSRGKRKVKENRYFRPCCLLAWDLLVFRGMKTNKKEGKMLYTVICADGWYQHYNGSIVKIVIFART